MKALTLWQPWASLIAVGAKRYETRGWRTSYRGPLLICAAKRAVRNGDGWPSVETVTALGQTPEFLPRGVALCLADLTRCVPVEDILCEVLNGQFSYDEFDFGNFSPGRFAWRLDNVRPLPFAITITGRQGLFDVPPDVKRAVLQQLEDADVRAAHRALARGEVGT